MSKARIIRVRTRIEFPETQFAVAHPFYGPANSKTLREQIRNDGLREPTSAQLAVFAHALYNGTEPEEQEATKIIEQRFFRGFTGVLFDPKTKLAYFINYPEFDENSIVDRRNLIERIDENYAKVPFEHLGERSVSWQNIGKHPYFVAWAGGEDGAEGLAELASKHRAKEALIWIPNIPNLQESVAGVAVLGSVWDGGGLGVYAVDYGDSEGCCAFGVFENADETNVGETSK